MIDHTTRMTKWSAIVAVMAFAIFAVLDIIHNFVRNDPVDYFEERPRRLLIVASIAIAGGLVALVFEQLSPRVKAHGEVVHGRLSGECSHRIHGLFSVRVRSVVVAAWRRRRQARIYSCPAVPRRRHYAIVGRVLSGI